MKINKLKVVSYRHKKNLTNEKIESTSRLHFVWNKCD